MVDESKELTLRVHDECVSVFNCQSLINNPSPAIQVMGLMSSALTFVPANLRD